MSHRHRRRAQPVSPPNVRPASGFAPDWRNQGQAAQIIDMPAPEPRPAPPVLQVNRRPVQDLRALIERIGRLAVERQLDVHRTTVLRWLEHKVKIPGHQHLAIRTLLGDLPGTDGKWSGWRFWGGLLLSPAGNQFEPGHVLSLILLRQQLTARDREIDALKVQLAMAEQTIAANGLGAANDARCVG